MNPASPRWLARIDQQVPSNKFQGTNELQITNYKHFCTGSSINDTLEAFIGTLVLTLASMNAGQNKKYDLEERTFQFAENVQCLVIKLPPTHWFIEDGKQLIRASASVGDNYIEANDSLSKKDF